LPDTALGIEERQARHAVTFYARHGHDLNKAWIDGHGAAVVENDDFDLSANVPPILETPLSEFFPKLVRGLHLFPAFNGTLFRDGRGYLPHSANPIAVGDTFTVDQFLSTKKRFGEDNDSASVDFQTPIMIETKAAGSWFRDISGNDDSTRQMQEVLGIIGVRLLYVSAPPQSVYHHFKEV